MKVRNTAPVRLEVLITIVDRKNAVFYADLIQSFDVNMQIVIAAEGTAGKNMLEYLGLSDNEKSVIMSITREDRITRIMETLSDRFASVTDGKGVAVSIPMSSIMGASAFCFLINELPIGMNANREV